MADDHPGVGAVSPPASNAEGQIFRPIRTVNAFEQLVERLGRAIKLGLLAPGERLPPERRLAEQLELSRSTVREALRLLYDAGYLEARRGRRGGVFVAQQLPTGPAPGMLALDGDGVRDLLAYRRCLELGAAELAAERASESQVAELAAVIERCEANATPETYDLFRAADGRFHVLLAHVAHSPRLVAGVTEVRAEVANLLDSVPRQPEALVGSTTHHRRVLAAIAEGDGEGARLAMREHLDATERLLLGVLPSV